MKRRKNKSPAALSATKALCYNEDTVNDAYSQVPQGILLYLGSFLHPFGLPENYMT